MVLLLVALFSTGAAGAAAHDPGLSAADVRVEAGRLEAHLTFARRDLEILVRIDRDLDGSVSPAEIAGALPALRRLAREALLVTQAGEELVARRSAVRLDESDAVHMVVAFGARSAAPVELRSTLLPRLPRGHRQYLVLRGGTGAPLVERVLSAGSGPVRASVARETGSGATMRRFAALGVEHILTGWDHLAFLLALLLAGTGLRGAAAVVTSFTAAHSITLALAALDVVRLPASLVEPLIAASIVYVALENVLRRKPHGRWLVTFGFGLVHGFGFAGALRQLGLGTGVDAAMPLVAFNLGVEAGQITVACLVLPVVWQLRREPAFTTRIVPALSLALSVLGGWWLLDRVVPA